MTVHTLYPGFFRLHYTGAEHQHTATLPVEWSTTPSVGNEPSVLLNNDEASTMSAALLDYKDQIKPLLATTDTIAFATAWYIASPGDDPNFIYQLELGFAGTGAGSPTVASQAVATLRTVTGGHLRLYVMEGVFAVNQVYRPPATNDAMTWANWAKGNAGFVRGRDGSKVTSAAGVVTKINDRLRRKYILTS